MAEKTIIRTIPKTTIFPSRIKIEAGKVTGEELAPVVITGEEIKDDKTAEKYAAEKYGKADKYAITKTETVYEVYEIPFAVFVKNAKLVETLTAADIAKREHEKAERAAKKATATAPNTDTKRPINNVLNAK